MHDIGEVEDFAELENEKKMTGAVIVYYYNYPFMLNLYKMCMVKC